MAQPSRIVVLMALSLALACADGAKPAPGADADSSGGDVAPDTGGDTASDSASGDSVDTQDSAPPEPTVRFVALGDAGEGNDTQYAVAGAIAQVCGQLGCDFAIYLGDNFYGSGVESVDDPQFQTKFELPYAALDFPFYVALGNHDYGGDGAGWELWKGQAYIDYTMRSDKWFFPDLYYVHDHDHVALFALDTTQLFWGIDGDQRGWLRDGLARTTAQWTIAFGHHPYLSNGPHGDAGNYEGLSWVPIVDGESIQRFVDEEVCDRVDVYFSGHDHSLQWPVSTCGTEFIVSGAGAKTTPIEGEDAAHFEVSTPGFMWVEIVGDTFTGVFFDRDANELYRRSFTR